MVFNYRIRVVDYQGNFKQDLFDFVSLYILDVMNDIGRWSIKGKTEENCQIAVDDSIIVYRDGVQIYNGVTTRVEQTYGKQDHVWTWTASGANHNLLLKYKVVFPDTLTNGRMENRYYNNSTVISIPSDAASLIIDLINKNAVYHSNNNRLPRGVYLINSVQQAGSYHGEYVLSGALRFDNLFDVVVGIANQVDIAIFPVYGESLSNGITYLLVQKQTYADVIFPIELDEVDSFGMVREAPSENMIIMSWNHETEDETDEYGHTTVNDDMYHYYAYSQVNETPAGIDKELFIEPNQAEFDGTDVSIDHSKLLSICQEEAGKRIADVEGYEIALNMAGSHYTYGYSYSNGSFKTDYRLGSVIDVIFDGEVYSGRLTQIQFNVSYGKEDIKATIGAKKRGQFSRILSGLNNLNVSMNKKNNAEVK